jgi:group I intron endonuclease
MDKGKIYKITNKKNGLIYIGCTVYSLEKRFYEHIYRSQVFGYKSKLYNSIRKYGKENFEIELISECEIEDMYNNEIKYIELFDTYNNGLNSTCGGEGCLGYEHTDETREKISNMLINGASHKNKTYEQLYGDKSVEEKNKRRLSVKIGWENMSDEDKQDRINKIKEVSRKKSKYGVELVTEIKNKFREGYSVKEIKNQYPQIGISYLYTLKSNKRWKDI